jgi:light-regulated signal transduction histidine kinase (bacteriophytochrome)
VAELPTVEGDPGLLKQVFANLLSNAVKYSRPRQHAVIEIALRVMNDESVIYIRDNGVGFNMKYADKLFGVFQRLHRAEEFEGTGVGLAIVERVVKRHGGHIWAESELDKGATFYFTLAGLDKSTKKDDRARAGKTSVSSTRK